MPFDVTTLHFCTQIEKNFKQQAGTGLIYEQKMQTRSDRLKHIMRTSGALYTNV